VKLNFVFNVKEISKSLEFSHIMNWFMLNKKLF